MSGKIVNLTVHKNNRDRIEDRRASRNLVLDAKAMARRKDVHGYAIVSWDRDQNADVSWSVTKRVSCNIMPEFVSGALRRKISMEDADA